MVQGREAAIIIDESVTRTARPLLELEALAAKAVALLACKAEWISATIFRKPDSDSYWISLMDQGRKIAALFQLKPQAPTVDFEVVKKSVSDLTTIGGQPG